MDNGPLKGILGKSPHTIILSLVLLFLSSLPCTSLAAEAPGWQKLDDGIYIGEFEPGKKSPLCNNRIVVIRIDPKAYSIRLLSASEHGQTLRTAKQWCIDFGLTAAINASMYLDIDYLKSTGYMRNYAHINNPYINKVFGALMLFNPVDRHLPDVQIIDRRIRKDWEKLAGKYNTVVQNYRMISNRIKRGWPQQDRSYATAAIGTDEEGNVLFILSRSPYSTHDLIHILLSLPIGLKNAMYVEGGPKAALYLKTDDMEMNLTGSCDTDLSGKYNQAHSELPNVIGIMKRSRDAYTGGD
ncbi:MAG: phosphodiester glycosidase family protein [Deltaproteobacteria bacterium]|nr:phosphodiester glycosidase family protein [Deltaproteobacteria bacterium]